MVNTDKSGAKLTRQDWLEAALEVIAIEGVKGLRVQDLAASLGATTGSLYWHFADRGELLRALFDHWVERSTEAIAREIEGAGGSPETRLMRLMRLVFDNQATSGDLPIRTHAAFDEGAAKAVGRADKRRAQVVRALFEEMGFSRLECTMRTQVILCYESCERLVLTRMSLAERRRLIAARHRMLCRR